MKKLIYISILLLFVSCSKFLEEPIRGVQTVETYFTTEEECQNYLSGCYQGMFQDDWWQIQFYYVLNEASTDDAWLSNPTQSELDYKQFTTFNMTPSNDYLYPFWDYMYKNIYRCNVGINGLENSPIYSQNRDFVSRLIAEAKFIRAYSHFELAKNFESLPIMTQIVLPTEIGNVGLSSQEEVYQQIIQDLKFAALYLPAVYENSDLGRATKGAALGYLSKAYLYLEDWQMSKTYADSVINQGGYSLEPVFGEIWDVNNHNSSESIFELQTVYSSIYATGNSLPIITGGREDHGWYYAAPTSHLEKAFLDLNDTIRLRATIIKAHNEATAEADGIGKGKLYASDGSTIAEHNHPISRLRDSKSMRVNRKLFILPEDRMENYGNDFRNHIPKNQIFLRLAEIKLNRAEAMWHMIHTTSTANFSEGDIINGDLHDIRSRVHLPDINSSGDQLLLDIYHERRLELAGEFRRWDDMRRAKHPSDGQPLIYHIMGSNGTFVNYNTTNNNDWWETQSPYATSEPSNKGINFNAGDEWMPIPSHDAGYFGAK